MRGTGHRDETGDHKYFSQIPHLLDDSELTAYEHRLYCHYKRVCSPNAVCYESVRTSALKCRLSATTVVRARNGLAAKGWITVELSGPGRGHTVSVALADRWQENMGKYAKRTPAAHLQECTSEARNVPIIGPKCTAGGNKEEPFKKNHEEDSPLPSLRSGRAPHKEIDPGFLAQMTTAFRGVDVQREYAKFLDWKTAKGRRFKDNRAAFRNWLRKAEEFAGERKQRDTVKAGRGAIRGEDDLAAWDAYKNS